MWRIVSLAAHVAVVAPFLLRAGNPEARPPLSICRYRLPQPPAQASFNLLKFRKPIQMRCTVHTDNSLAECRVLGDSRKDLARLKNGEPKTLAQSFEFATAPQIFVDRRASGKR